MGEAWDELSSAAMAYAEAMRSGNRKDIWMREIMLRGAARNYAEESEQEDNEE